MVLSNPFPVYGKVKYPDGTIPTKPKKVVIQSTISGVNDLEVDCDENGYYQTDIRSIIDDYGDLVETKGGYKMNGSWKWDYKNFTVLEEDLSKNIEYTVAKKNAVSTDSISVAVQVQQSAQPAQPK